MHVCKGLAEARWEIFDCLAIDSRNDFACLALRVTARSTAWQRAVQHWAKCTWNISECSLFQKVSTRGLSLFVAIVSNGMLFSSALGIIVPQNAKVIVDRLRNLSNLFDLRVLNKHLSCGFAAELRNGAACGP